MQQSNKTLLSIQNLYVSFRINKNEKFDALKGISFSIPENSIVALVGESGSGKSVTSLAIMGLLAAQNTHIGPTSRIIFEDKNLLDLSSKERRQLCGKDISMIFQEPMTSLNPVFTAGFQIAEVLRLHMGMDAIQARARTLALLDEVGIASPETKFDAYPNELSGGQQQRVMIAMAIACEPTLLIADEPTTALDMTIQKQIIDLINALRIKRKMSVLFITHDLALVSEIADSIVVMRHGEIREMGDVKQVFQDPNDAYTKALLHCRPTLASRPWRLPVINDYLHETDSVGKSTTRESNTKGRTRGLSGSEEIVLDVKNLSKSFSLRDGFFSHKEFKAVDNISFKLARGKTLGIVGESGSGKTTVGLTLLRLHQATSGCAIFNGKDILSMSKHEFLPYKKRIQIIFQNPYASLNPRFTVGQILMEPMRIHQLTTSYAERVAMAFELLDKVGLPATSFGRYPHEFSGGQRQRIAIARCLTMKPEVLVCDESVSALDVSVQAQILNLLQNLQDEFGLSYLFISHDLAVVKYIADQVMVMKDGRIVEMANSDALYSNPSHEYTRALLRAIPGAVFSESKNI
jgi:peptide/nickel transport system ATP-binding protein